jgi:hypothetical protein
MADSVDILVINAAKRKYSVRLYNYSDGTGETLANKLDISTLTGLTKGPVLYTVIEEIKWDVQGFSSVRLYWDHDTDDEIAVLSGQGLVSYHDIGGLVDPRSTGGTGDILLSTAGTTAGSSYDITIVFRLKDA